VGYILLQLLYGILSPTGFDRLLAGPSNDVWLTPWVDYLELRGARIETDVEVGEFLASAQGLTGVSIHQNGVAQIVTADYYIAALPVEVMQPLVTASLKQYVPSLAGLQNLTTAWMNGIQFYLKTDVPLNRGHTLYSDSPWALTSISQNQFWTVTPLAGFGDSHIGGILSVDISDWTAKGTNSKTAMQCTPDEIAEETWAQLKQHLNVGGALLQDENLVRYFLDPDIQFPNPSGVTFNAEPLLVNTAGSLQYRPDASTALPNFFLASDYVRTNTDLACMEAANEAARRAVNGILKQARAPANVSVWPLAEPSIFQPMIDLDRVRFQFALPH
jgi:15-cis-phytoene desaturase